MVVHFYLDGSGHVNYRRPRGDGDSDHYALCGILATDAQRNAIEQQTDDIIRRFFPDREPRTVEIKTTEIKTHNKKPPWSEIPPEDCARVFDAVRDMLLSVRPLLFGQVIHKENYFVTIKSSRPEPPALNALRFLMRRVDGELKDHGLQATVTIDDDSHEMKQLQLQLEASIRAEGDKIVGSRFTPRNVSKLENVLPFKHLPSHASRCLQMADYVSHFTWQGAEYNKAKRIRELDAIWRPFEKRREPWVAFSAAAEAVLK